MKKPVLRNIKDEEQRTVRWYLTLFYSVLFIYDFSHYYFIPKYITQDQVGSFSKFNYLIYIVIIGLLPVTYYLKKIDKQLYIKYIYFISYILISVIVDIINYYGTAKSYAGGNVIEVFLVLFSPLFISSRFFLLVSCGSIIKYILIGIILKSSTVILPIILILILSFMALILLNRFKGYVNSVQSSYDKQLEGIVKGIIATLELKDPYTKGHSERVAGYAILLAEKAGNFTYEELKSFNYACLLHDIGKINIPDHILMKPSKLTKEEFEIIKSHPAVGAEAVKNVDGLGNNIHVIRSHHERWDGTGYPDQFKGEEIPFLARVTAIADAFDAMTSSRSYRAAMPVEKAFQLIIEGAGTQFDPTLVEEFKTVFPQWVEFHKKYPWSKECELQKVVRS
jgi:HD-GYP domain-containing protein (c-di-GMP phosphodiesterase class II)